MTKKCDDDRGGIKNYPKPRDVIYGWPQTDQSLRNDIWAFKKYMRKSLKERERESRSFRKNGSLICFFSKWNNIIYFHISVENSSTKLKDQNLLSPNLSSVFPPEEIESNFCC